ncbi:MAG: hypothetical protein ACLQF4_02985 [Xanthobacteraceae bacterium]
MLEFPPTNQVVARKLKKGRHNEITRFFAEASTCLARLQSALAVCGSGYNDEAIADVIAYKTSIPINLDDVMRVFSAYDIVLVYPSKETYMVRDQHLPEIALLFRSK